LAFKGLRVISRVAAARGIANVADGGAARILVENLLGLVAAIQAKRLGDHSDLFVGLEDQFVIGIEGREAGGELPAILHVKQHPRDQVRDALRLIRGNEPTDSGAFEMVKSGNSAFVLHYRHRAASSLILRHHYTTEGGVRNIATRSREIPISKYKRHAEVGR